jgi:hypothetical protein
MRRPPTSPPPIQLLPQGPRAISTSAAGFSLSLHAGLLALAAAGSGHWITPQPSPIIMPRATIGAVIYVADIPSAHPQGRSPGRAAPSISRSRLATRSASHPPLPRPPPIRALLTLPAPVRQLVLRTGAIELVVRDEHGLADRVGTRGKDDDAGPNAVTMSADSGRRGASRVAELLAIPSEACPELRRPAHLDSEVELEVAVKFVVDSLGAVDRTTLRVVKAPGTPPMAPEFIPHIYAIGGTARVDRSLPEALPQYGAIIANDLLRHVARLRFRPGTRNGRPSRSSVLVACSAVRSGH